MVWRKDEKKKTSQCPEAQYQGGGRGYAIRGTDGTEKVTSCTSRGGVSMLGLACSRCGIQTEREKKFI